MSTAQAQHRSAARSPLIDYLAFTLLFASVSIAVAVALGGIVLLLTASGESSGKADGTPAQSSQLAGGITARQAGGQ
ncbi:MAG: hypothetical protein IPL03_08715 [Sterolibacteriaceae bacterium]|nr:hypothetical protein [Candidatus Methylophosphatis haderslevensis]